LKVHKYLNNVAQNSKKMALNRHLKKNG